MTTKTTGVEFKAFYKDPKFWNGDTYHDDTSITVDDQDASDNDFDLDNIPDTSRVVIKGGIVFLNATTSVTLEAHFKHWRREQKISVLVVECPVECLDGVTKAILESGGKIKGI